MIPISVDSSSLSLHVMPATQCKQMHAKVNLNRTCLRIELLHIQLIPQKVFRYSCANWGKDRNLTFMGLLLLLFFLVIFLWDFHVYDYEMTRDNNKETSNGQCDYNDGMKEVVMVMIIVNK